MLQNEVTPTVWHTTRGKGQVEPKGAIPDLAGRSALASSSRGGSKNVDSPNSHPHSALRPPAAVSPDSRPAISGSGQWPRRRQRITPRRVNCHLSMLCMLWLCRPLRLSVGGWPASSERPPTLSTAPLRQTPHWRPNDAIQTLQLTPMTNVGTERTRAGLDSRPRWANWMHRNLT